MASALQIANMIRIMLKEEKESNYSKSPSFVQKFIASEASYAYILSGQKFIKNAKNSQFKNLKLAVIQCYQTGHFYSDQKLVENAKIKKSGLH